MLRVLILHIAGIWIVACEDLNLCKETTGNFSVNSHGQSGRTQTIFKLQDDSCVSDSNILLLKIQRIHCPSSSLAIKELPIEKDICKHKTGRCFIFTRSLAGAGLTKGLPFSGCKHLHWMHGMSKVTVRLQLTGGPNDGVDFWYYFSQQHGVLQDGEESKPMQTKMELLVLTLVSLVVILAVGAVIVTARMCHISRKYQGLHRLSKEHTANDTEVAGGNATSNVSHDALLVDTQREVIPNRLYAGSHLYEDARF